MLTNKTGPAHRRGKPMSVDKQTSYAKASPSGVADNDLADIDSALCSYRNVIAEQRAPRCHENAISSTGLMNSAGKFCNDRCPPAIETNLRAFRSRLPS